MVNFLSNGYHCEHSFLGVLCEEPHRGDAMDSRPGFKSFFDLQENM